MNLFKNLEDGHLEGDKLKRKCEHLSETDEVLYLEMTQL